jgi:hypothetical protein
MNEFEGIEGEIQIVREESVCNLSRQGWRLVRIVESESPHLAAGGYTLPSGTWQPYQPIAMKVLLFVMHKPKDAVMDELRQTAGNASARLAIAQNEIAALGVKLKELEKDAQAFEAQLEKAQGAEDRAHDSLDASVKRNRLLEEHLGKVREAIGSDRFREITGQAAP